MKIRKRDTVLFIPDLHLPAENPNAINFLKKVEDEWGCNKVIQVGDVYDLHNWSRYERHPLAPNRGEEVELCRKHTKKWAKAFPDMDLIIGNHDYRWVNLLTNQFGLEVSTLKFEKEVQHWFSAPKSWRFHDRLRFEACTGPWTVIHGDEQGASKVPGKMSALLGTSVVRGHTHTKSFVNLHATEDQLLFDVIIGCMVDEDHPYAFSYRRKPITKDIIACMVLYEGVPHIIPHFKPPKKVIRKLSQP